MRFFRIFIITFVIAMPFAFRAYSQEAKQPSSPDTSAPAAQEVKQEPAPAQATSATEAKPQAKEAEHRPEAGKEKRFVATVGQDGVQHVEIVGGEYYFDPNYIVVKVNIPVELKLKKAPGYVPHDIAVKAPEAGIDFKLNLEKDWQTVKFTPTKTGKYEMVCDKKLLWFKSHKDRGMDGFIEVVE